MLPTLEAEGRLNAYYKMRRDSALAARGRHRAVSDGGETTFVVDPVGSDAFCAADEIRLKPGKGGQESDQRILDPHDALCVLFQAAEVAEGQRLATEGVRQTIAPDHFRTL